MKIQWTQYVTALWTHARTAPGEGLLPTDCGWYVNDGLLKPTWFEGSAIPDSLFPNDNDQIDNESDSEVIDTDNEAWSDDSDLDEDDENN